MEALCEKDCPHTHQHCDESSCSQDSFPFYRLTEAPRAEKVSFVVIIHAISRMPKKVFVRNISKYDERAQTQDHMGCETLKQKFTVSENGLAVELKYRIYGNSPSPLIPIDQVTYQAPR